MFKWWPWGCAYLNYEKPLFLWSRQIFRTNRHNRDKIIWEQELREAYNWIHSGLVWKACKWISETTNKLSNNTVNDNNNETNDTNSISKNNNNNDNITIGNKTNINKLLKIMLMLTLEYKTQEGVNCVLA